MRASVHTLSPDGLKFLKDIDRTSGRCAPGAFVRRSKVRPGPRDGWAVRVVFGLAFLAAGVAPLFLAGQVLTLDSLWWVWVAQTVAAGLGAFLLAGGVVRLLRKPLPVEFGSFLFADGTTLWEVNRDQIETWPLADLERMDGRVTSTESGTVVLLTLGFAGRSWYRTFDTRRQAETLLHFLSAQKSLRNADDPGVRLLAVVAPGRFAAVAQALAEREGDEELNIRPDGDPPPEPWTVAGATEPRGGVIGGLVCVLATAAVAAGGYFGFKPADLYALDGYHFSLARNERDGEWHRHDEYLSAFPNGRFVGEARASKDDRKFAAAEKTAKTADSPVALRDYLSDEENTRHRAEAKAQIAVFYDRVVADLKRRAADKSLKIDRPMFDAVIAMVEGMKAADRPVVTVGFRGRIDAEPATEGDKLLEQWVYDAHLAKQSELKGIAARFGGTNGAILSRGATFDPVHRERREGLILNHLREALNRVVKKEVLAVEAANTGEKAVLEVGYHIKPSGSLYVYTSTSELGRITTNGLLRGYDVTWAITVTPPGAEKSSVWELKSEPLSRLKYEQQTGDPDWAPYAVILYSAFHDMSARLVGNFAVTPPAAPNVFTYSAVASTRSDSELFPKADPVKTGGKKPWER